MNVAFSSGRVSSDRVPWVDIAKGLCIILVVMGHATLGVEKVVGQESWMGQIVAFAKPFRIPDFFVLSGLFIGIAIQRDWRTFIDRRVVHFAYFYILWLLIIFVVKYGEISGGSPTQWLSMLLVSFIEPFSTLWFLYLLVIFSLCAKILGRFKLHPALILAGAALLEIAPIHTGWTVIDEFCARLVYFLAGWLLAPHIFALAEWAFQNRAKALAGLGLWAVMNGLFAFTASPFAEFPTLADLPFASLMLGMVGAVAITVIAALLSSLRVSEPLRYCGEHSIAIYLAFFLPMAATRLILIKTGIITETGLIAFIVTLAAVIAPLVLERFVRHTPARFLFQRPKALHVAAPKVRAVPLS